MPLAPARGGSRTIWVNFSLRLFSSATALGTGAHIQRMFAIEFRCALSLPLLIEGR